MEILHMSNTTVTEVKAEKLYLRPTKRRDGSTKAPNDQIDVIWIETDLFPKNYLITSDLHSHSSEVFRELVENHDVDLSSMNVITLGDMAGDYLYGTDADPTDLLEYLCEESKTFYCIQGNHDLPPEDISRLDALRNDDGTPCIIPEGEVLNTPLGRVAGTHGSHSLKRKKPYVRGKFKYCAQLLKARKKEIDVLMTHDTYEKKDIMECVKLIQPKIHLSGHYHLDSYHHVEEGIHFFNVDARVLIINSIGTKL